MAELAPGVVVAGCRIEAVVGRGGMGVVYRATQRSLDRQVALKAIAPELASDDTFRERFKRESQIAASIEHPNVIPVYEAGEGDGLLYLTMRYIEGTDLRALIATEGRVDPVRSARIVGQVAAALAAAHRRGLVHRDVKPANVLLAAGEADEHAYLTDFGIARHVAATSGLTRTGAVVGTIDYLAPERIRDGSGDASADIYGLGCVLFEALTGSVPYPRDNDVAKMYAHLNAPVPTPTDLAPTVPAQLADIARRAMAKDPADRFDSATEMSALLLEAAPAAEERAAVALPAADQRAASRTATEQLPPTSPAGAVARDRPEGRRDPRGSRPPWLAILLSVGAAAGAIVALLLLLLGGGDEGESGVVNVGPGADGVAVGLGYVWVANQEDDTVVRVEPETKKTKEIRVGRNPDSLAIDTARNRVWVTNTDDGTVNRITPAGRVVGKPIRVGRAPEGIAVGRGAVWVANSGSGSVTRLGEGLRPTTVNVGPGPIQIAFAGRKAWVTLSAGRRVVPLDADTAKPAGEPVVLDGARGARARGIAYGDKHLWVSLPDRNKVYRFDPKDPRQRSAIVVLQDPRELRYGEGGVWISHGRPGVVTSIDPRTQNKGDPIEVGPDTYGLGIGIGRVWAASQANGDLVPIDPRSE
jgi:protein kinase-like protein